MSRGNVLSDEMWARIEPLMPPAKGAMGPPWAPHRQVVEGAIYRLRTGIGWRDLPRQYGAHTTVHRRFKAMCEDVYIADFIATLAMLDPILGGIDR